MKNIAILLVPVIFLSFTNLSTTYTQDHQKNETDIEFGKKHPGEEDIILNKLDIGGQTFAKNSSGVFLPANSRNGVPQSSFRAKDTLHLYSVRDSPLITLRIEYDSLQIVSRYKKNRPKFIPGTDGLFPESEHYYFESALDGKKALYVIELVFRNLMMGIKSDKDDQHVHGHICDPISNPLCGS